MSKSPNVAQSQNIPPWQFKGEKGAVEVGCLENSSDGITPLSQSQPVIAQSAIPVLEDGKQSESIESSCVQSQHQPGVPGASSHEVLRLDSGQVLENIKMTKELA